MVEAWWQDWRRECVAIIASGPSASKDAVQILRDRIHVIAINESWRLAPWADVLYGCDAEWWKLRAGVPEFTGLKIRGMPSPASAEMVRDENACRKYPDLFRVDVETNSEDILSQPGRLGAGGNSGFQAVNLAVQFGATAILLIGFDMRGSHWHGRHPQPLRNPDESSFPRWRKVLDGAAGKLRSLGVDVVNASPVSALNAYPKMTTERALARWGL